MIHKWRIQAMLEYIELMLQCDRDKEDIIEIIDGYLDFIDGIRDEQ